MTLYFTLYFLIEREPNLINWIFLFDLVIIRLALRLKGHEVPRMNLSLCHDASLHDAP